MSSPSKLAVEIAEAITRDILDSHIVNEGDGSVEDMQDAYDENEALIQLDNHIAALIDAKLAPLVEDGARMEVKLHAINLAVDGYVDGAPDAGPVAKLANEVSLIINPPDYP